MFKKMIVLGCLLVSNCAPRSVSTIALLTPYVTTPTPVNVAASNSTETAEPRIVLQPISYGSYTDSTGKLWIVGEIGTDGAIAVQDAQIIVSLLDKTGRVAAFGSGLIRYIPAYSKFPFRLSIDNAPKQWDQIRIQAQGFPYDDQSIFPIYTDLRADKVTGTQSKTGYKLNGEIINAGEKTAIRIDVVAAAYGENGPVIDVGSTTLSEIAPGNDSSFSLVFSNLSQAPPSYWVYIVSSSK